MWRIRICKASWKICLANSFCVMIAGAMVCVYVFALLGCLMLWGVNLGGLELSESVPGWGCSGISGLNGAAHGCFQCPQVAPKEGCKFVNFG